MNLARKISSFFNSLYPVPGVDIGVRNLVVSLGVGLFVAFALFFSNLAPPIDFRGGRVALVLCYGLVTVCIMLFFEVVIPVIAFQKIKDQRWSLWKEIVYVMSLITAIAVSNFLVTLLIFPDISFTISSFSRILVSTVAIAILPTIFCMSWSMYRYKSRYNRESAALVANGKSASGRSLLFTSQYAEEDLSILVKDFCFAEAESNYVSFYFYGVDGIEHEMRRTTLKAIVEVVGKEDMVLKTHRSYVINLANSSHFSGNSQGYVIHFDGIEKVARVSRSYTSIVKKLLSSLA